MFFRLGYRSKCMACRLVFSQVLHPPLACILLFLSMPFSPGISFTCYHTNVLILLHPTQCARQRHGSLPSRRPIHVSCSLYSLTRSLFEFLMSTDA
ncbi:hypothetical protein F5883DRAFT_531453 [Diaporthe sp. PMI_573]|nr:hypothetical protein F5883DRAFT_531453 [Diaporthaceae sp. PMI_573]